MAGRLARVLMIVRDVLLILMSIVLMSTSYGKWVDEPVHLVLFCASAVLLMLSVFNLPLAAVNVRRKAYFYFNAVIQILLGVFYLILGIGIVMIILNIVIVVALRRKGKPKEPEQRA